MCHRLLRVEGLGLPPSPDPSKCSTMKASQQKKALVEGLNRPLREMFRVLFENPEKRFTVSGLCQEAGISRDAYYMENRQNKLNQFVDRDKSSISLKRPESNPEASVMFTVAVGLGFEDGSEEMSRFLEYVADSLPESELKR